MFAPFAFSVRKTALVVQNVVKVEQIAGFRCCITKRINLLQKCMHSYEESIQTGRIHGFIPGASGYNYKPVCRSVHKCIAGGRIRNRNEENESSIVAEMDDVL